MIENYSLAKYKIQYFWTGESGITLKRVGTAEVAVVGLLPPLSGHPVR